MILDQNLFTLSILSSKEEPGATDLIDPSDTIHYRKRRKVAGASPYQWDLYDPHSESLLATVSATAPTSKQKTIELHNPSAAIQFSFTGKISFKWIFEWEDHTFEWRREECYIQRKPDPPVLVAVTREDKKAKTAVVQLLDYNIHRFSIQDRKGLEVVILCGLLTFQDYTEGFRSTPEASSPTISRAASTQNILLAAQSTPPPLPPKTAASMIASLQAQENCDINEIVVGDVAEVNDYVEYCMSSFVSSEMLWIVLRSHSPANVSKVVAVAEETKRAHYRSGEELHQYVSYQEYVEPQRKGPRVIKLDEPNTAGPSSSKAYQPPPNLTIHLSKISMPELQPKAQAPTVAPSKRSGRKSDPPKRSPSEPDNSLLAPPALNSQPAVLKRPKSTQGFFSLSRKPKSASTPSSSPPRTSPSPAPRPPPRPQNGGYAAPSQPPSIRHSYASSSVPGAYPTSPVEPHTAPYNAYQPSPRPPPHTTSSYPGSGPSYNPYPHAAPPPPNRNSGVAGWSADPVGMGMNLLGKFARR
ncbi:hypothetical protein BOTBODRAFT_133991 [Botryobasidium botryosum FD-172 SS1]|uniref:Uncharacterized protein n=1 Tax=Botryobasidium botryosum (strain FD-172 SS1) TaxID=930990 RepID=A0A067MNB1_BOTB1|nr:hypothetical protein BOTBODRAFT_133991 [Botryobasidium botryosum FD-172 SS1]